MRDGIDAIALGVVATTVLAVFGWLIDSDDFIVLVAVVHLGVHLALLVRMTWRQLGRFAVSIADLMLGIVWKRTRRTGRRAGAFR